MVWKKEKFAEEIVEKGKDVKLTDEEQLATERDKPDFSEVSKVFRDTKGKEIRFKGEINSSGKGIWK